MTPFTYAANPARVIFGRGTTVRAAEELERLGASRALILTTAPQAADGRALAAALGDPVVGHFSGAEMHTPTTVTERALAAFRNADADAVVAIGGGSTIGLGKAIALRTDCPSSSSPQAMPAPR